MYISFNQMATFLLYIVLAYLAFTTLVFIRNLFEFRGLSSEPEYQSGIQPKVSICIPARNEARVIERCITHALKQNYLNFEVLVLDDQSTDGTTEIVSQLAQRIHNLFYFPGKPKPEHWLGKPWACHQLSKVATGDYLVFIDADVALEEDVLSKTVQQLQDADAITIWPQQHLRSFWERLIIPQIYYALWTLLPARYVEKDPKWLPGMLRKKLRTKFSAACGQFIAFNLKAYQLIGGHESVKDQVVEDVGLAKRLKSMNFSLRMLHGTKAVYCRMYTRHREIWEGLRKNFFLGFNKKLFLFGFMAVLHLLVFIFPLITLCYGALLGDSSMVYVSSLALIIILAQRFSLDLIFRWNIGYSFLQPFSVLWFQALGVRCVIDHFKGNKAVWKGREV